MQPTRCPVNYDLTQNTNRVSALPVALELKAWWCRPIVQLLWRLRCEDQDFKTIQGNLVSHYLTIKSLLLFCFVLFSKTRVLCVALAVLELAL